MREKSDYDVRLNQRPQEESMDKDTYDRPEPKEKTANRAWLLVLGALAVAAVLYAMATGVGR